MGEEWAQAYYDATRAQGSRLHIEAEFGGTSDISWIAAGREFARGQPALRPLLDRHRGEFKSPVYFATVQSEELRSYTSLYERLRDGPRLAQLYIYSRDEFSRIGLQAVDVREKDVPRLPPHLKQELRRQVGIAALASSPIAGLQERLVNAGVPNYRPSIAASYFDPAQISTDLGNKYQNIVQVAARTEAVFGDLKRIESDPKYRAAAAIERLDRLLRTDRYFDRDYERALVWVLAGLFDIEMSLMFLEPRVAMVDEYDSARYDGIQAADIAAAVARETIRELVPAGQVVTAEALARLVTEFRAVVHNGVRLL